MPGNTGDACFVPRRTVLVETEKTTCPATMHAAPLRFGAVPANAGVWPACQMNQPGGTPLAVAVMETPCALLQELTKIFGFDTAGRRECPHACFC